MSKDKPEPIYQALNEAILSGEPAAPASRRRRVPRRLVSWLGRYRLDGDPSWGECEVVDISVAGAGALLHTSQSDGLTGRRITIEVRDAAGGQSPVTLTGQVRHAAPALGGWVRVGVAFGDVAPVLEIVERMGVLW